MATSQSSLISPRPDISVGNIVAATAQTTPTVALPRPISPPIPTPSPDGSSSPDLTQILAPTLTVVFCFMVLLMFLLYHYGKIRQKEKNDQNAEKASQLIEESQDDPEKTTNASPQPYLQTKAELEDEEKRRHELAAVQEPHELDARTSGVGSANTHPSTFSPVNKKLPPLPKTSLYELQAEEVSQEMSVKGRV